MAKLVARDLPPQGISSRIPDVAIKSPNDGLPPYELENVLGRRILRALRLDKHSCFKTWKEIPASQRARPTQRVLDITNAERAFEGNMSSFVKHVCCRFVLNQSDPAIT